MAPPFTLPPLSDDAWPPESAHLLPGFAGRLNVYRVMAHDPALLNAWETLRNHVVLGGGLSDVQRELVILRTGFRWRAGYEWAHHVSRGRAAGLGEEEIASAAEPLERAPSGMPRDLFAAVDALLTDGALSPPVREAVHAHLDARGVLDLMATVGFYSTLAFIAKTFDVPVEDDLAHLRPDW